MAAKKTPAGKAPLSIIPKEGVEGPLGTLAGDLTVMVAKGGGFELLEPGPVGYDMTDVGREWVGKNVLVFGVDGWHYVGFCLSVTPRDITLVCAARIAHDGRGRKFFEGQPPDNAEVEPFPQGQRLSIPRPCSVFWPWQGDVGQKWEKAQ